MNTLNHSISLYKEENTLAKWASFSFGMYLFFVFFGTSKPFPDSVPDTGSSNFMNQLLSVFYVISLGTLWGKQDEVLAFIRKEKFLTLLMLWALASVFWSIETVISLKRWIGLFGEIIVCLAAMLHFKWSEVALRHFRVVLALYFPLTIVSVIFVPGAMHIAADAWRGLEDSKNNLGQIAIFGTLILIAIISFHREFRGNIWHYILLAMSIISLAGSKSTTSFLIGIVCLGSLGLLQLGKLMKSGKIAVFYALMLMLGFGAIVGIVSFFAPEIPAWFFGLFGKDLTFTGRVELWQTVLRMTQGKELLGWGLGGFWIMDSPHLIPVFQEFVWIPNQSHQGYIDTYNQLGIVGLVLLLFTITNYFWGLARLQRRQVWKWIFFGLIVLNFQESIFFRPRHVSNFLFVFTYIALFTDLLKEKKTMVYG